MTSDANRRRYPRLFMAHKDEAYSNIVGAKVIWPNGHQSQVLDMSYAGIAVSPQGVLSTVKEGQDLSVQLKIGDSEAFALQVRIVRVSAALIGLKIETTSIEGRLKIDQHLKDQIVGQNTRKVSPDLLHPSAKAQSWYHGPFDTNLFIWRDASGAINKVVIEYDNLILSLENGQYDVVRSYSANEETKGYAAPFMDKNSPRVSMGASWLDRLKKMLVQVEDPEGEIRLLLDLLNKVTG